MKKGLYILVADIYNEMLHLAYIIEFKSMIIVTTINTSSHTVANLNFTLLKSTFLLLLQRFYLNFSRLSFEQCGEKYNLFCGFREGSEEMGKCGFTSLIFICNFYLLHAVWLAH